MSEDKLKRKKRAGQRKKLTPELIDQIAKLIELGVPYKYAAEAVGASERSFHRWMSKGRETKRGLEWQLWQAVKKAQGKMIARKLAVIEQAAQDGSWQAAAWLLERRFPEEFGRREKLHHEGGMKIVVELVDGDDIETEDDDDRETIEG